MSLLIGQGIGRWGNYANQEAFGVFTNGNYGMMSDKVISYIELHPELYGLENVSDIASYIELIPAAIANNADTAASATSL